MIILNIWENKSHVPVTTNQFGKWGKYASTMEPVRTSAPLLSSLKGHPESARIAFHVSGALALMQQHACNVQVGYLEPLANVMCQLMSAVPSANITYMLY